MWTSREGVEYAWFNNVETKPGVGYPKKWENQKVWNGGWERKNNNNIQPKIGAKFRLISKIFANPDLPEIDDYYEPFTFEYERLQKAPESKHMPTARAHSVITGKKMEKPERGPNWEEILGGEFEKRREDSNFQDIQADIYGQFENTFMMYLPRLCEHCLISSSILPRSSFSSSSEFDISPRFRIRAPTKDPLQLLQVLYLSFDQFST